MTRRNLLVTALGVLVAALIFGSVQTTGALWTVQADTGADTDIHTGTLSLDFRDDSPSIAFEALKGPNMAVGTAVQAELEIVNSGDTPLRFQLATAGPVVETTGAGVGVVLSGAVGTCPGLTTTALDGAFPARLASSAATQFADDVWHHLGLAETTLWCIRVVLDSVSGTRPATFTIEFDFDVEQVLP